MDQFEESNRFVARTNFQTTESPEQVLKESLPDLARRWEKARIAALKVVELPELEQRNETDLNRFSDSEFEEILKQVFLNSRNLGKSYQKNLHLTWELSDIRLHFKSLQSPCLQGKWREKYLNLNGKKELQALSLNRSGCSEGGIHGSRYCQFWRESIDGLVMGLCEEERFARHGSKTCGDSLCVDVFYYEQAIPSDAIWESSFRWGVLTDEMKVELAPIVEKFSRLKVDLQFLGLSENILFYKMESMENLTCGSTGAIFRNLLKTQIEEQLPGIQLRDASPVAVYGEKS